MIQSSFSTPNPLQAYIENRRTRFVVSAHLLAEAPREGLAALMEHPGLLDWYQIVVSYRDTAEQTHRIEFTQWQQQFKRYDAADCYSLLMPLLSDLDTYIHYPTPEKFLEAGVAFPQTAARVWTLTMERGLLVADLLGPDLQGFLQAYADWAEVPTSSHVLKVVAL